MKAADIHRYLESLEQDAPENSVDRIIYGDSEREVAGIAVCFMPYSETILQARDAGANVMVVHEPTFYAHRDLDDERVTELAATKAKMQLLDELEITVIRCHDRWDWRESEGIMASWAQFLGLSEPVEGEFTYKVTEQTALEFARYVAQRVAGLGQRTVRLYGDAQRKINSVCVFYGRDTYEMLESGADLIIAYDDYPVPRAWTGAELCHDTGYPMIVVNHGVLEEPGVASLATHLRDAFPAIPVVFLEQGCTYQEVSA